MEKEHLYNENKGIWKKGKQIRNFHVTIIEFERG